jgi:glucose/arabinose dehydrogenase
VPRRTSVSAVRETVEPEDGTKRFLAWSLIALAAVLVLSAGCGGGESQSSNQSSEAEDTASQTELAESETPAPEDTQAPQPGGSAEAGPVEVATTVVATGLEAPWDLVFTPDGRALVTERDSSRLLSVDSSGNVEELQRLPENGTGEGGLLGIALSPNYESDGYIYAYYTTDTDNRVTRFRLGEDPEPILTGIPVLTYHNGGRIAFGPDGNLYVGTGDAGDTSNSQDLNSLGGKILRLTPDGDVPADNPFSNSPVYSYGHRNVQGLAWDEGGQLYATEFGQNRYDEVNRIRPGGNYGWPEVEGEGGFFASGEYIDPIATWATSEASPSGAAILKNGAIPQWEGSLFMAALRGQRLYRLALDPSGTVTEEEELLSGQAGRLRHVVQAPDGSLWVLTSNRDGRGTPVATDDRILRLAPAAS